MDNSSLSGKSAQLSELTVDDIPEAVRDTPTPIQPQPRSSAPVPLIWRLLALSAIGGGIGFWIYFQSQTPSGVSLASPDQFNSQTVVSNSPSPTTAISSSPSTTASPSVENVLGHLPYKEAPPEELQAITPDGGMKLRKSAAVSYEEMTRAAAAQGIYLVPISAFRSVTDQQHVFFDVKAERRQNATKRAEVSAPPGYSEHHTGYAIDIGDANAPATNLSQDFENTQAFKWLQTNATSFNFELSFPKNNIQGVSYEPWHWRYVGDRESLETFYKAHSLK